MRDHDIGGGDKRRLVTEQVCHCRRFKVAHPWDEEACWGDPDDLADADLDQLLAGAER